MAANTAFEFSIKPLLDVWRVETCSDDARSECAQFDAALSALKYTSLYGLRAVDITMMPFAAARRTWLHARRDSIDDYKLVFQISGNSVLLQDDAATALRPGDFGIVDLTLPVQLLRGESDGHMIGLHLPRQSVMTHLGFQPQGGRCWRGQETLPARLLQRLLADSIADGSAVPDDAQDFIQLAIYNLIGGLFGRNDLPRHFSHSEKLFLRLCAIIKKNFADPDIAPVDIASEAGISLRYLQKIFAIRGTTSGRFLKTTRLNHAARLLHARSGAGAQPHLVEIAISCGYRDYAHFARDFRARFGQAPGAFSKTATSARLCS
jgi:AraC family transcriptional activator of tynA and feaB